MLSDNLKIKVEIGVGFKVLNGTPQKPLYADAFINGPYHFKKLIDILDNSSYTYEYTDTEYKDEIIMYITRRELSKLKIIYEQQLSRLNIKEGSIYKRITITRFFHDPRYFSKFYNDDYHKQLNFINENFEDVEQHHIHDGNEVSSTTFTIDDRQYKKTILLYPEFFQTFYVTATDL